MARGVTLREAIVELGGVIETVASTMDDQPYLLLGNAEPVRRAMARLLACQAGPMPTSIPPSSRVCQRGVDGYGKLSLP